MDLLTKIHNKLNSLSKGKRRIAQYLLDSYEQAAFQTASVIGKTVDVSESTVVRFATDLGYDGYPDLQKALQELVRGRLNRPQQDEKPLAVREDLIASVLQADMQQLRTTMQNLDCHAFEGAVDALLQARRVYILGNSTLLIGVLRESLECLLEDVRCIVRGEPREILRQLLRISPTDVLLFVGTASHGVNKAMEFAQQSGAKTIALTDENRSSVDYLLCVKCNEMMFADSLMAPLGVIHALITAVSAHRKQETAETLERLEEIWDVYHV